MADQKQSRKRDETISGPGAADFVTSLGGLDRPESGDRGTAQARDDDPMQERRMTPRPGPDTEEYPGERNQEDDRPGSQTGTIGGGGADAHNPSPVRATGSDDEPGQSER